MQVLLNSYISMATKGKQCGDVKEKRGLSPNPTTQRRTILNSASPDKKPEASTPEKHIPNYLKPTISSSFDPSKHYVKKQSSSNTTHKPTLTRRRSFDKPPSPSQLEKTLTSPNCSERTLRSSSFSAKTTTLPKAPRNVKKSVTPLKKQNNAGNGLTKKAPTSRTSHTANNTSNKADDAPKLETSQEDQESSVTEAEEEMSNIGSNSDLPAEILILEDKEHMDVLCVELENANGEELKNYEFSSLSEDQISYSDAEMVEPEHDICTEETASKNKHDAEDQNKEEKEVEVGNTDEKKKEGEDGANGSPEDKAKETEETGETEEAKGADKEANLEMQNVAEAKQQGGHVKKDSAAYNDVIEETASKLREQRKNKVKALVGAFETVISLQEPEAPSPH
ncbi:hypothetical protein RJ640_003510 [Escallonia rubra]|uniref:Calmodulin-binding domain-containing protein n=1 Tax=Escallonia rubra TaxID=112253 RepID=A0AA88QY43_9ASTE|nr:hypothetical protein RJ640_003510 [Escallonia rubra]